MGESYREEDKKSTFCKLYSKKEQAAHGKSDFSITGQKQTGEAE